MEKIINSLLKNKNPLESLNNTSGLTDFKINKDSLFEISYEDFLDKIDSEILQVKFLQEVVKNNLFKVFLTGNKKIFNSIISK